MYVVHPDWLRPRNRGVLINCEGFTQVHRFKLSFSRCDIFSGSTLPPSRGGICNWWRCTRSPPSRRARGSAERGDRQGLFLNWAGGFSGFLQSIRPTEEFEGQNKSIKSRVRSTLLIWDTFAFDRVVDVSARVLLRLSPHASLYPSHLPYLFLRQMRYLPWKHKMLKMSTREQCQWELPASHVLTLSEHFEKVVCGIWKADVACEDYRQALSKEIQLLKLGKWCLFDFRTSNPVGDLALEIRRTMPLRFLRKQSCWGSGSRDSESSVSSIFEKVIMLGVWLSRFGGRCLFDFGASNLVGSVFSNVSKGWTCLLVYLATKHRG
ncbi:hypothetical protein ACFX12_034048 [Malus domestica]